MSANLDAALAYARRGWSVFPCHSAAGGGCSCGRPDCSSPAKHPRVQRGLHAASTDRREITRWWRRWPEANVAIRTGTASGLVVVDVDPRHGGLNSMRQLLAAHEPLPPGPRVRTGGRGSHFYFAHPGGRIGNDAGRRLGPGLDVRGDGGYVIAPPSGHVDGRRYGWVDRSELPVLPGWLQRALEPAPIPLPRPYGRDERSPRWAEAVLVREAGAVARSVEGTRNNTLNRAAFRVGRLVGEGLLDRTSVAAHLGGAAQVAGLPPREVRTTLRSGLDAGARAVAEAGLSPGRRRLGPGVELGLGP